MGYFVLTIRTRTLEVAAKSTDTIGAFRRPINISGLRPFFGLLNVHRRFVPNFASIGALLNVKLKKGEPQVFEQSKNELAVVEQLKAK